MHALPPPIDDAATLYDECVKLVSNPGLRGRFVASRAHILGEIPQYADEAKKSSLYRFSPIQLVNGIISKKEMMGLYSRMLPKERPPRKIYDSLMAQPKHRTCPFCGQRKVSTLDHYLAKAKYPTFAVTPINLVPCCKDCNGVKKSEVLTCAEEQFLHPYYDNFEAEQWLFAEVFQSAPPTFNFFVSAPATWDAVDKKRLKWHVDELELNALYSTHAAEELENIKDCLTELHAVIGKDGVAAHLNEQAVSRLNNRLNQWQSAFYQACAANVWFCDGGFNAG